MRTYVATNNPGKLRELKALLKGSTLQLAAYRKYAPVLEIAESYAGNAILKATALAAALRERGGTAGVLADDSGLEVAALGGRPGVHSARYGGPDMEWPARRATLLSEMRGIPPYGRRARFVCVLAFVEPQGEPITATGTVDGFILESESGSGGFGYDSIFLYPPAGRSFAAMSEKDKNAVSHRHVAAQALIEILRARG